MESVEFNPEAYDRYLFDEEKYSDEDFAYLMAVVEKYQEILKELNDENFEINPPQYQKLLALYAYFMKQVKSYGGHIDDVQLSPREEHGGITVFIPNLNLECGEVGTFCKAISYGSALTIDSGDNGNLCLSVTVPNIFKEEGKAVSPITEPKLSFGDEEVGEEASKVLSKSYADIRRILENGEYRVVKSAYQQLQRAILFFTAQKEIDDSYGIEGTELLPVNLFVEAGCVQLTTEFIVFQPTDSVSYKEFLNVIGSASSLQIFPESDKMHVSMKLTFDGLFEPV